MESNWRRNIADMGWAFSPVTLSARLLPPYGDQYICEQSDQPLTWQVYTRSLFSGAYEPTSAAPKDGLPFPGTFPVVPDSD